MHVSNVCAADQYVIIVWLHQKCDAKIPCKPKIIIIRVVPDARLRAKHNMAQYLTNTGETRAILGKCILSSSNCCTA